MQLCELVSTAWSLLRTRSFVTPASPTHVLAANSGLNANSNHRTEPPHLQQQ